MDWFLYDSDLRHERVEWKTGLFKTLPNIYEGAFWR